MSLRKEAARGVFWTAAGNWGYQLTTLVVFAVLSRLLVPEAFGLVALALVFTEVLKLITEQGMADAIVQRRHLEPAHLDTALWMSVGIGGFLTLGVAAGSTLIADVVNEPELGPVLQWLSLTLLIASFSSVQKAILTRELRFSSLTARILGSVVAGGLVGIAAALAGFGVWSLVAQMLTMEVVGVLTLWTASDWRPHLRFSRMHFGQLFSFGANVTGYRLLRFFNRRIDNLMVGSLIGATALGFYVVAYRLLNLIINITTSVVGSVAFPVFARIQDDRDRVQKAYYKSVRLVSVVSFPAFAGLIVVAPEATRLVFGDQWDASVPVMRVLAIAGLLQSIIFVNSTVIKSLGKPQWRLLIMGITAVGLLVSFAYAVQFGIVAVALALVIVSYATAPLWLIATHRLIDLRFLTYLRQIGPSLIASLVMSAIVVGIKLIADGLPLLWLVVTLVLSGIASYILTLLLIARPMAVEVLELTKLAIPKRGSGESATA